MTDDEKVMLVESDQRSKSAIHQIEEVKEDIKEIKADNKAIYELTSSVKIIAENVSNMKEDIKEIKQSQTDANEKIDKLEKAPYEEYKATKHEFKMGIVGAIGGGLGAAILGYIGAMIVNGTIKL
jgi:predicted  nucleic acid-binding Zn-ribbon protein